jgi:hypothetical protein
MMEVPMPRAALREIAGLLLTTVGVLGLALAAFVVIHTWGPEPLAWVGLPALALALGVSLARYDPAARAAHRLRRQARRVAAPRA